MGPMSPRTELIFKAVCTRPNLSMSRPALISIVPAMRRSKAIVRTALSSVVIESLRFTINNFMTKEATTCLNT